MPRFSALTIIELINALDIRTHAGIEEFAMRFNIEHCIQGTGVEPKLVSIKRFLKDHPEQLGLQGAPLVQEIFEYYLAREAQARGRWDGNFARIEIPSALENALRQDGYSTDGTTLLPLLPAEIQLEEVSSELQLILGEMGLDTAKEHLQQGRNAYVRGDWAAANGCFRSAVESMLIDLANERNPQGNLTSGGAAIRHLAQLGQPLVHQSLNEWDGQGKGFMEAFWRRLHPHGPHPGLSNEEDCTFRMQLVVVVMHYMLLQARRA